MPSNDYSPNFCLMTEVDMRGFTGTLYTRNNSLNNSINITLPTASQIVFTDAIDFLNGGGMHAYTSLDRGLGLIFSGEAGFDSKIQTNDHIYLDRLNGSSVNVYKYNNNGLADRLFGLTNGGTFSDGNVLFGSDWQRGLLNVRHEDSIVVDGGGFKVALIPHIPILQDIPSYIRERSNTGIYPNGLNCLSSIEHDNFHVGTGAIPAVTWFVDGDGHVNQMVYSPTANQYLRTFAWVNTDFRDRLGFNGLETWTAVGNGWSYWWLMKATNPMPGVLVPSRPLNDNHLSFSRISNPKPLLGGGMSSNYLGNYVSSNISFYLDALSDIKNLYGHYVYNDYFYEGAPISFYQLWGDSRFALRSSQINANQPAYTNTYTSELDGFYGVIRGHIESLTTDLPWPEMIRRRVPIEMSIRNG